MKKLVLFPDQTKVQIALLQVLENFCNIYCPLRNQCQGQNEIPIALLEVLVNIHCNNEK